MLIAFTCDVEYRINQSYSRVLMFLTPHVDVLNGSAQLELTILPFLKAAVLFKIVFMSCSNLINNF